MALKDWKQGYGGITKDTWYNQRTESILRVLKEHNYYIVWLSRLNYSRTLKKSKTKSQALKFAKEYMKKY